MIKRIVIMEVRPGSEALFFDTFEIVKKEIRTADTGVADLNVDVTTDTETEASDDSA